MTDPTPHRPRRSVLYMPASNTRALAKARTLPVDGVILDLEDAVAPDAKADARRQAVAAVREGGFGHREVVIRVNGAGTPWHDDDLREAAAAAPDAVAVPKVGSPEDVHAVVAALDAAGAPTTTAVWAMVETPAAMLDAARIAGAHPRLTVLVMGTNDLAKELHVPHVPGRAPLLTGLGLCLLAARAHGLGILDGVYNDVSDPEGFAAECRQGRQLGFDGKTLIHPGQIAACTDAFSPSDEEVAEARELITTWEAALAAGRGVATFRGRMVENLHVDEARRILATAPAGQGAAPA